MADFVEEGRAGVGEFEAAGAVGFAVGGAKGLVFLLKATVGAHGVAEVDLIADDGEQARVVPGLRHEIAGTAAPGFDGDVGAGLCRHDHDGKRRVDGRDFLEQREALLAARGVAGLDGVDDGGG